MDGAGFLWRHKLENAHAMILINESGVSVRIKANIGSTMPLFITKSLSSDPSPAMFPSVQTACSHTFELGEERSLISGVIAPKSTTCLVFKDVPDTIFDSDQAASN